jgi:hypothetical protein
MWCGTEDGRVQAVYPATSNIFTAVALTASLNWPAFLLQFSYSVKERVHVMRPVLEGC